MKAALFKKYLCFSVAILFVQIAHGQRASDIEREGMQLFFKNDLYSSLDKINSAIKIDSLNPQYYDDRACIYEKLGKYADAYNNIDKALKINAKYLYAYHHKSNFLLNEFRYSESINTALIGLALCKKNDSIKFNFYNTLGIDYSFTNEYEKSIEYYALALALIPNNTDMLNNLSAVQSKAGKKSEAINTLMKSLAIDSLKPTTYNNLGMRYIELEKYVEAINNFNKSILLNSASGIPYNNRGFCYYKLGKFETALNDINNSILFAPNNPYAFRNRALVYLAKSDTLKACEDLNKAEELGYSKMFDNQTLDLLSMHCK